MPRTLWPLFSPDTVYIISLSSLGFRAVVRATILHKCSYYFCIYAVHFVQMTETSDDDDDDDDADVEWMKTDRPANSSSFAHRVRPWMAAFISAVKPSLLHWSTLRRWNRRSRKLTMSSWPARTHAVCMITEFWTSDMNTVLWTVLTADTFTEQKCLHSAAGMVVATCIFIKQVAAVRLESS